MLRRKSWRDKATATAITRKVNRQKNPVTTYTQLAREFGAPVYGENRPEGGPATSSSFRSHVISTVGNVF